MKQLEIAAKTTVVTEGVENGAQTQCCVVFVANI